MADERPETRPAGSPGESRDRWLTAGVASVGSASFFSDSGHEVSTALLPVFVTTVLHGTAASLGVIEGVSDAVMGIAKLVGGPPADDPGKRQRMAVGGYLGTAVATGAIGLSATVWQAGALRAIAWTSRGVRSPARDALLGQIAPPRAYGRAYGLERAGDNLGAVVGPLLAALLVATIGIRPAMWCAAIPGVFAAIAITLAVHEARRTRAEPARRRTYGSRLNALRQRGVLRVFIPVTCFECGNVATTLLILRATQLLHAGGRSLVAAASLAIVIYAAYNAAASVFSIGGGRWLDHSSPGVVFAAGAALYVASYLGFAIGSHSWAVLLAAFVVGGAGIGCAETTETVLIARAVPDDLRGSGFGALGGVQAVGDIVASVTVGALYAAVSPLAAFCYAAAWMALALCTMPLVRPPHTLRVTK